MEIINSNRKFHYRFIKHLLKNLGCDITHERTKQIIFDKFQAILYVEKEIVNIKNAYFFLLSNLTQLVDAELIKKAYYLLTGIEIDEELAFSILKQYFKDINENGFVQSINMHYFILENVKEKSEAFAFIITNFILEKKEKGIICLKKLDYFRYKNILSIGKTYKMKYLFRACFHKNKKQISTNEIKKIKRKIKKHRMFIKEKFHIIHLFIYGSYAKKDHKKDSDLDLLYISDEEIGFDKYEEIKEAISKMVEIKIDLINFDHAMKTMGSFEMEQIKKIY